MKPYHDRPKHLRASMLLAGLDAETLASLDVSETVDCILDRHATESGEWQYKLLNRDGVKTTWLPEDVVLQMILPWELDTFHSIYELRNEDKMPSYAKRIQRKHSPKLTKAEALQMFPMGTPVAREETFFHKAPGVSSFVKGSIKGYFSPWWRVRYEDGEVEDLSKSQVRSAMGLYLVLKAKNYKFINHQSAETPQSATVPEDFGPLYSGSRVHIFLQTGWCSGTLVKHIPKCREWTFDVRFDGEHTVRRVTLLRSQYSVAESAHLNDWHLLT
jgi:hypothetical protein